jgi:hypothetical protein
MKNPELPVEMDEVEVKVDIQSTNASADEPRTAKRQGFELARIPEDPASKPTALSSPKKPKAASSSSSSPRAQPPACQVEKCAADLADAKEYYRRHRVCEQHSKARVVLVLGLQQRFCQQCSRSYPLLPKIRVLTFLFHLSGRRFSFFFYVVLLNVFER